MGQKGGYMPKFSRNDKIRLVNNPSKIGVIRDDEPNIKENGRITWVVKFDNGRVQNVPEEELELYETIEDLTLSEMVQEQRFSYISDVQRVLSETKINGNLSDILYSMDLTNTDFYAYQFKPVLKIINSPSNAILVADEVGLGKTIEAGLIWTELKQRYDYKRLLIICPKVLTDKWKTELRQKIGVKAEIIKPKEFLERFKVEEEYAFICGLEGIAQKNVIEKLKDYDYEDPLIDLLIVDEAHKLRNSETKRNHVVAKIRELANYATFLSATPIQNKNDDLFSLVKILDSDNFTYKEYFDYMMENIKGLVSLKKLILESKPSVEELLKHIEFVQEKDKSGILSDSKQMAALKNRLQSRKDKSLSIEEYQKIAYELDEINSLGYIFNRTRKREVKENAVIRRVTPEKIAMSEEERELFDLITETIYEYAENKVSGKKTGFVQFLLCAPQRMLSSSLYSTLQKWRNKSGDISDNEDEYDFDEEFDDKEDISEFMQSIYDAIKDFHHDKELYDNDTKYNRLLAKLREFYAIEPDAKVVLFSTFVPTLEYLSKRLNEDGINGILLTGKTSSDEKPNVLNGFQNDPNIKILLASEVGSEGVDLQFCHLLINYDLPWNPMRVEQRIGRLDRIGQKSESITVWNIFHDTTIDDRVYNKLQEKMINCESILGGFGEVLGKEFEQLNADLLLKRLTPEERERQIDQTLRAITNKEIQNDKLEQEASELVAYGDYILNQIRGERHKITSEDLSKYVVGSLQKLYDIKSINTDNEYEYEITLTPQFKYEYEEFCKENSYSRNTLLLNNTIVTCVFNTKLGGKPSLQKEIININHSIIKFLRSKLSGVEYKVYPVSVLLSKNSGLPKGLYVIGASLVSAKGITDYAKIVYSAYDTEKQQFVSEETAEKLLQNVIKNGSNWSLRQGLDYETLSKYAEKVLNKNEEIYEEIVEDIKNKNIDRANVQSNAVKQRLAQRTATLNEVINKHLLNNKIPLAKATQGTLEKEKRQMAEKLYKIEQKSKLQYNKDDICVVILKED